MYKVVLDADGLIKLTKSGLMHQILSNVTCLITDEVYKEVVVKGKEGLYEDAFAVDIMVRKGKIIKLNIKKFDSDSRFSAGELSTLQLYKEQKVDGIISDDRKFLSFLESEGIPFIVPTHLIALLAKINRIKKQEAIAGIENIREFIREDAYLEALKYIRGDE